MSSSSSTVSVRRRVCTACQTSKRRCDQRLPRCSRCAQRNQDCVYPSLAASREPSTAPAPSLSSSSHPIPPYWTELNIPLSHFNAVLPGSAPVRAVPVITGSPNPWPLFFDAQGPANTAISRPAMDWGVSQLSMFPLQWVADGLCPFINTHLYGSSLPPALKDAYAVCAAYAMKNHLNSSLVLGIVESKADSLLYDPEQLTWTPQQQLAAVQSLVMYQLIRWFDGDIRQRALADQAEAVLDSWTEGLLARVGQRLFDRNQESNLLVVPPPPEPGDTGLGGGGVPPGMAGGGDMTGSGFEYANSETVAEWRQFLFAESCRRIVIFAYTMRGIYAMAKQGYCHLGNRVAQMSFTGSSRIWEAGTASRWSGARASEAHHWVERMDFEPILISARPDEVDALSGLKSLSDIHEPPNKSCTSYREWEEIIKQVVKKGIRKIDE
ncbi:hypothetical protein SCAR479_11948 [Seiridium cardinale]|uniref:Zn(2)-C6 fungal-type domain-containing protein n=1 Tax=Seiridium cardinale TaxID=138064 RepID=A0ABR2XC65_9PEZI